MPAQYETNFIIQSHGGLAGVGLLDAVVAAIEEDLQSVDREADYELETNQAGAIGYAHFSGERSHPSLRATVRLEVRLCTLDEKSDVAVQILTRFISAEGADFPEQSAGPPRLLDTITRQFKCRAGINEISSQPVELNVGNVEAFAKDHILNAERTLPIFLITQDSIDPALAQRMLQGVAQVAHCAGNADQILLTHTGIRTYGGAARIYWPGCRVGQNGPKPRSVLQDFFMPDATSRLSWPRLQQDCIAVETAFDFDARYSVARSSVVRVVNSHLNLRPIAGIAAGAATAIPVFGTVGLGIAGGMAAAKLIRDRNRRRRQEHQQEEAQNPKPEEAAVPDPETVLPEDLSTEIEELSKAKRIAEVHNLETNRKFRSALTTIEQLTREKENAAEIISQLEYEIDELRQSVADGAPGDREARSKLRQQYDELRVKTEDNQKTIAKLNADNQWLRQRERMRSSVNGNTLSLGEGAVGNITTLNHALNIYREPCRKFIVQQLQAHHGNDLTDALSKSVEFRDNQRRNAALRPESAFDIGDFSEIIAANSDCFENSTTLRRRMDDVKHIRNRAAHPPSDGFNEDWTQDSIRTIAEALECLGDQQSEECAAEIRALIEAIRSV